MQNSIRTYAGRFLHLFGVRRLARRLEQSLRPKKFRADSPETPRAVERALDLVVRNGLADRGDYLEFGLYRGYTLWSAQNVMRKRENQKMRFFGFDSFQGFPEVRGPDAYKGDFSKGQFNTGFEFVRKTLTRHGIDWRRTVLVPGYFDQTLTDEMKARHALKCVAVVLIDCVLYESTKLALAFSRDLLTDGSVLVFDDWNAFDQQEDYGERRAFREFLEANPKWKAVQLFHYGVYGTVFQLTLSNVATRVGDIPIAVEN